jgi:hypothetical protein
MNNMSSSNTTSNSNFNNKLEDVQKKIADERTVLIQKINKTFLTKKKAPATSTCFYHVQKIVGKGSFGKVFLGTSLLTQKVYHILMFFNFIICNLRK